MAPSKRFVRGLFVILLVAGCIGLAVAPLLRLASAAPISSAISPDVVISEFRFIGPGGENDEFIELFNRSCSPVNVGDWSLVYKNGQTTPVNATLFQFTAGTTLQPGQYYLIASAGYTGAAVPDNNATRYVPPADVSSKTGGVALLQPGVADPVDQVGVNLDTYHEGTALDPLTAQADQGYRRKVVPSTGQYVDVNNNKEDFDFASPSNPQNSTVINAAACGIPTETISGNTGGLGGVILRYTDIVATSVTSDASGNYTITIPANWSGTVSPSKAGYAFTPVSRTYNNVLSPQTTGQDYTAAVIPPTNTPVPGYGTVVINEVAWMGTKSSLNDKWIELYNPNPYEIDLTNWELTDSDGVIGTDGTITFKPSGTYSGSDTPVIAPHGYFVIAQNKNVFNPTTNQPEVLKPDYIDPNLKDLADCSGCGERLTLYYRASQPPVDYANYGEGKWPAGNTTYRQTMERHSTAPDSPANWFTYVTAYIGQTIVYDHSGYVILGTPGEKNWAYTVTATPSPVPTKYKTPTPLPPTPFGHLVINEFLPRAGTDWNQDNVVDVYDEFIEVKNLGPINANLQGWKLNSLSSAGTLSFTLPNQTLQPGQRAVFYRKTTGISLPDSGGTVRLINTRNIVIDARSYGPVSSPDQSTCRIPDGYYWRFPCFPTPGNENSLTGIAPIPPPIATSPPCLMSDIVPDPFRDAECYGYGSDMYSAAYWDDQSGFNEIPVQDAINKDQVVVK